MSSRRLPSIDLLRGAAIVGMVLVDEPAVGPPYLVHQLTHAAWNGWTLADTVFPAFLFVMGLVFTWRFRRFVVLAALGLALNALPLVLAGDGMGHLRIMGVLQRIALASAVAGLFRRRPLLAAAVILLVTWALLATRPLTPASNLPGLIDRHVLGVAHMYPPGHGQYDPEGLLGTLPAAAGVLIGVWAGDLVRSGRAAALGAAGVGFVAIGSVWSTMLPINKRMWTPSFVVFMSGIAMVTLAVLMLARDHGILLRMVGSNPLVVYVGASATGVAFAAAHHGHLPFTYWAWNTWLRHPFGGTFGNVVWALGILALWWAVAAVLWQRRWFVRV